MFTDLTKTVSNPKYTDQKEISNLLEELDLFAFNEIYMGEEKSNSLIEVFKRGFENTIEYIFYDGFVNIRAILKKNNKYETLNEVA